MIDKIFSISKEIRYVAIYRNNKLETQTKDNTKNASSSESDKYEELLTNPVMLKAATQRGNIDCGGLDFLLVGYGNFYQYILPMPWGHVSVCIDKDAEPLVVGDRIKKLFEKENNFSERNILEKPSNLP